MLHRVVVCSVDVQMKDGTAMDWLPSITKDLRVADTILHLRSLSICICHSPPPPLPLFTFFSPQFIPYFFLIFLRLHPTSFSSFSTCHSSSSCLTFQSSSPLTVCHYVSLIHISPFVSFPFLFLYLSRISPLHFPTRILYFVLLHPCHWH